MNKLLTSAIALSLCTPAAAMAAPTLYGKVNVSYASANTEADDAEESLIKLDSNASRIGVKGSEKINDSIEAIYKAEFEVAADDGDAGGSPFKQRNIYVGLKGDFGSVIAGNFDTPLKQIQNKVDLFGDLYGDIKNNFTTNENRAKNSLMYSTPNISGFTLYADLIASEQDNDGLDEADQRSNATSIAATYEYKGFYGAVAYDLDVEAEGTSTVRGVLQYNLNTFQIGFLAEGFEKDDQERVNGAFGSIKYGINNWVLKGQFGFSDIKKEEATTLSLGVDYKLSKKAKIFGFYTNDTYTIDKDLDTEYTANYLGLGVEVKF
ncbi:porin [Marinagarivorans algicola]|uniref:porin n=1 Tax=Marinagarivorans algicola TaxID=1513270 RepID=UPI0006B6104A|nr:porin [Marinagarivorans algicola]